MKLIKPKAELLLQQPELEGVYKQIELAGRTCYKSTDKITDDSAKPFIDRMIASKHYSVLEHGTVYLYLEVNPENCFSKFDYPLANFTDYYNWSDVVGSIKARYHSNPYSRVVCKNKNSCTRKIFITTNLRVIIENGWEDDLQFVCTPTEHHEKRYTFKLTTSIGVSREFNRHRVNSMAEQSTRYCNYSKDKFGNEITFCIPSWIKNKDEISYIHDSFDVDEREKLQEDFGTSYGGLIHQLSLIEDEYMYLLEQGWKPQQAREILPLCTATEIVHTAFASDWKRFFDIRYFGTTGQPHPNMIELTTLMKEKAEKHGIWNDIHNIESERTGSNKAV